MQALLLQGFIITDSSFHSLFKQNRGKVLVQIADLLPCSVIYDGELIFGVFVRQTKLFIGILARFFLYFYSFSSCD